MLLTNGVFREQGAKSGMNLSETFEFGVSYAETLRHWRDNFHQVKSQVAQLGFDERFMRLWDLYLSYCEGAFRAGRISVGQFTLEKS
jgi:cyclopropane-fatty-acyl-phospholipid synthase